MKVYIYQEEWISRRDYVTEKAFSTQTDVYETFEAAEKLWTDLSNMRNEREGHKVSPAEKEDQNTEGQTVRYYIMHYGEGEQVMIKTTIAERTVL